MSRIRKRQYSGLLAGHHSRVVRCDERKGALTETDDSRQDVLQECPIMSLSAKEKKPKEEPKFPKHLEEFKKAKEKIEKAEGTDFKAFLRLLKAR